MGFETGMRNSIVRRSLDALNVLPRYLSDELVNDGRATQSFQFGTLELTGEPSASHMSYHSHFGLINGASV